MTEAQRPKNLGGGPRGIARRSGHRLPITHLTIEQEAYCRARAMGMDIRSAVAAVGNAFSFATAKKYERENENVIKRIEELSAMASQNAILKTGLTRQWVIERLMTVVDRCMQAEPVLDRDGNETGEFKFDSGGANRALQLLGQELGMFTPREEKPGDEYANLSEADLTRLAQELAAQTGIIENHARTEAAAGSEQVIEVQALPSPD